jgi:hypothetical protein
MIKIKDVHFACLSCQYLAGRSSTPTHSAHPCRRGVPLSGEAVQAFVAKTIAPPPT